MRTGVVAFVSAAFVAGIAGGIVLTGGLETRVASEAVPLVAAAPDRARTARATPPPLQPSGSPAAPRRRCLTSPTSPSRPSPR